MICPKHGKPLVAFCPSCRGQAGGRKSSPKKTAAVRLNAKKPRATNLVGQATKGEDA